MCKAACTRRAKAAAAPGCSAGAGGHGARGAAGPSGGGAPSEPGPVPEPAGPAPHQRSGPRNRHPGPRRPSPLPRCHSRLVAAECPRPEGVRAHPVLDARQQDSWFSAAAGLTALMVSQFMVFGPGRARKPWASRPAGAPGSVGAGSPAGLPAVGAGWAVRVGFACGVRRWAPACKATACGRGRWYAQPYPSVGPRTALITAPTRDTRVGNVTWIRDRDT